MQIHVFIAHMGIGGAERVCVNLANEWARQGHEVHIVTLNLDGDINTQNLTDSVEVHTLGVSRLRYSFIPMWRYIRKNKPGFMFVFGNEMAIIIEKLRSLHMVNVPVVVRVLNNVNISLAKEDGISPAVEAYLKKAQKNLTKMQHVVAQCEAMGTQLTDRGLASNDRLSVIYNPVSRDLCNKVIALRASVQGRDKKEITFIGRIDPQKNPFDLLKAFAKVHKADPDTVLRFVGGGVLTDAVSDEAKTLGVDDSVIFDGIRSDMENIYATADVIALSSDYEGMPNCLIEAIGCGIPIVSYDCPIGPSEIVEDDVNGYLIPMGDVDALADGLKRALNKSWDKNAIISTCDKFGVEKIAEQYIDIFEKVSK